MPSLRNLALARRVWTHNHARRKQLPPEGDWLTWLILTGRGWGKTRTGAEDTIWNAIRTPNTRWAAVAATWGDMRHVMFEGESGLLAVAGRYGAVSEYNKSQGLLLLSNGSRVQGYGAEKPDRLRGPQHHGGWCDEVAAWRYDATWTNLKMGLRLGDTPRVIVTTTPRPTKRIRTLLTEPGTQVTRGATIENEPNLSAAALAELDRLYGGTRLGRQELLGEVLDEAEGALWSHAIFDEYRVDRVPGKVVRRVVGVDPATTSKDSSDETGIIVASITDTGHMYVEQDLSGRHRPDRWARIVTELEVDSVVVEVNQGGDMVTQVLRSSGCEHRIRPATATAGKRARAEPVSAMYQQGRVHHVGSHPDLEDQAATWVPGVSKSPDRVDALVWAISGLTRNRAAPVQAINNARANPWAIH